jgi:chemotaxis protein MotB
MDKARPIVIIKKKAAHGGHHGGAWKVAYADFVTAMMALFIVLWLMNSSKQIQQAIGGYFKDPSGTSKMVGTDQRGSGENVTLTKDDMAQLKEQLQKSVRSLSDFDKLKNQIEMTATAEGLRIALLETASGTFFESGSTHPNDDAKQLLGLLA